WSRNRQGHPGIKNAPFTVVGRADRFSLCAICGQAGAELQILHRSHLDVWHLQMCAGIFCSGCARATRLPEKLARSRLEGRTADPAARGPRRCPPNPNRESRLTCSFPGSPGRLPRVGTFSALPTLLSFSFLPSRLLAST